MLAHDIESLETPSDWLRAHQALTRLARQRAAADAEEGRCLLAALRAAAHLHLGFASFGEYVERLFGYGRRCTQEKLRVAEALERLPVLARALEQGALSWSAPREITRVVVSDTQHAWLEVAQGKTIRQLEELVNGKHLGGLPTEPSDPAARRHILRFEVSAETFALLREALVELRRRAGTSLDDDAALLELARNTLSGPTEDGRASYQIALTQCPACGAGRQVSNGELVTIAPHVVEMARCDAQHLGHIDQSPANDGASDSARTEPANDTAAHRHAHVGAQRSKQGIPPALRRSVLRRDHKCCGVPGCRNATFLDLHHILPRSEGGTHHADNLLTVCGAHHVSTRRSP